MRKTGKIGNVISTFGSLLPQRNFSSEKYRFGWNKGSEKDNEITGVVGAHITTFFREYDTRLGRTWTLDPVFQPWQSPYTSMDNNPILLNDPLGDLPKIGKFFRKISPWHSPNGSPGSRYFDWKNSSLSKIKFGKWRGLANLFTSGLGHTAPTGRMVNIGFNQTTPVSGSVSSKGNPIDRTKRFNFGNVISDHPRNKITGVQFRADASGDGSIAWLGIFNVKGLTGQGRGWSIANSGLQNIIPTWRDPMSVDYMEGRSGIIPGLNLLPTALANYVGDRAEVLGGLLVGTMAWAGNVFNRVNPALGRITSLEVQYRSLTNTQATFTLQYKARVWQKYGDGVEKSGFVKAWHRLWYGYD